MRPGKQKNQPFFQVQAWRSVPAAQEDGRVRGKPAPGGQLWRQADGAVRRAVLLHGYQQAWALQASVLPILSILTKVATAKKCILRFVPVFRFKWFGSKPLAALSSNRYGHWLLRMDWLVQMDPWNGPWRSLIRPKLYLLYSKLTYNELPSQDFRDCEQLWDITLIRTGDPKPLIILLLQTYPSKLDSVNNSKLPIFFCCLALLVVVRFFLFYFCV